MNKKEDKFQFVTMEDIEGETNNVEHIEVVDVPSKVSVTKKEEVVEEKTYTENSEYKDDTKYRKSSKFYFGFKTRVIAMILIIVCLFVSACILIIKTLDSSKTEYITYAESSDSNYQVCRGNTDNCLGEGDLYKSADVGNIKAKFDYNVNYSEDYKYDVNYHISAITTIYDKNDSSRVLYRDEETLVDKTNISDTSNNLNITNDVYIDYYRDNDIAVSYKDVYKGEYKANVEIALYLDNLDDTSRKVSSITIPLNEENFEVTKANVNNKDQKLEVKNITWNEYNTLCAVIASTLILISLILIYRTTQLVLKTTNNTRSKYEQKVLQILREYDNIIVVARGGYESNESKEVVKVDNFDKLLDVKDKLNKPIIYSKLSSAKCEFIVDSEEKLYKFVMLDEEV